MLAAVLVSALVVATPAQGHSVTPAGRALEHAARHLTHQHHRVPRCVAFDASGHREPCPPANPWGQPPLAAAWSAAMHVPGPYQAIDVVNAAGVDPQTLEDWERAELIQLNLQVRPAWGSPAITFSDTRDAWQLWLEPRAALSAECPATSDGCHRLDNGLPPYAPPAAYALADPASFWEYSASHELIEMMVDPTGARPEVCDPLPGDLYTIGDATVAQFVSPAGQPITG